MKKPTIPERLHQWVLDRAAEGLGTRPIAERLAKEHKVKVSHTAVGRTIRTLQRARTEVTRAVIAEKVGAHVASDLDLLDAQKDKLQRVADALHAKMLDQQGNELPGLTDCIGKSPLPAVHAQVVARLESIVKTKLDHSGAGVPAGGAGGVVVMPSEDPNG